ncbi:MAG TPA: alpha/beta hydrolase [Cellvibrio sp.]|nr:alpha/beta hydrolase [Cellvibrio sp.]
MDKIKKINAIKNALKYCAAGALLFPLSAFSSAESLAATELSDSKVARETIAWKPCGYSDNPRLMCARFAVPLNHQRKHGDREKNTRIDIALIKLPAADPGKKKLGSLFLNPGGPGGSGVELVRAAGEELFNQQVRDQYDLIGFDPRGVGLSEPLSCDISYEQAAANGLLNPFPLTDEQERQKLETDNFVNSQCAAHAGAIIHHMSTADVARDLELMRRAVGDKLLNYVGYSYGSYLGVTYANLYPQNVGHMVIDGVLDPIQWSTGWWLESWFRPVTTRLGSDRGGMATLNEFFRLCDLAGTAGCSFSGNSAQRYAAILQELKVKPLPLILTNGEIFELTEAEAISSTLGSMYNSRGWGDLADMLSFIESRFSPVSIGEKYAALRDNPVTEETIPFDNFLNFNGVLCSDSNNPIDPDFWHFAALRAEMQNGYFARLWTWNSSPCVNWPGSQQSRYIGPFNHRTKNTVLIANTLFDPATPYAGAKTVARLLPNSRLVTVAGWGHLTPGLSSCADNLIADYLLFNNVPAADRVCKQEALPFGLYDTEDVFAGMGLSFAPKNQTLKRVQSADSNIDADADHVRRVLHRNIHFQR